MSPLDMFPETLPRLDADDAREFAVALLADWFGGLRYSHGQAAHSEILESLDWPGMREFAEDAGIAICGRRIDFDEFAAGIRAQARRAERDGLVVPDGKPRRTRRSAADTATGELFAGGVA